VISVHGDGPPQEIGQRTRLVSSAGLFAGQLLPQRIENGLQTFGIGKSVKVRQGRAAEFGHGEMPPDLPRLAEILDRP
jgi:hypothetical protein